MTQTKTAKNAVTSAYAVKRSYGYDRTGNLTRSTDQRMGTTHFEYDKLGRMTKAGNERFAFDPAHNILDIPTEKVKPYPAPSDAGEGKTAAPLSDGRSAVPDNRLKTYNGTTYYYDDLGNLIHRELADGEVQNYFYDLHDQLVKAEIFKKDGSKETWAYTYDALGRRIGKGRLKNEEVSETSFPHDLSGNGLEEETGFVWDGSHLLQEVHPDGRYTYLYTDQDSYEPLAQVRNWTTEDGESRQQIHYFHCDQIGIPREMTDKDGNLVWFGDYYGWGKLKSETNVTGTAHQPFRLQNQYCDCETGLHYNFFRYYEPDAGRFVNQDPIGLMGGSNFYQFSTNTQNMIDPLGLNAVGVAKGVLSVIAIDTMTPDPSDVAWPKWIAYGVLGAAATGVVALSESDTCTGKCQEEKKRKKCLDATVDNIKMVTAKTSYLTLQKSVSIPAVARYTALIERGNIAPPVKMDGNTIVDGNHRMVAGLLCNRIPASTPGTAPLSKPRIPLRDIQPDPIDWW